MGKQWSARLVADFYHHKEIKVAVKEFTDNEGIKDSRKKIPVWSRAVTAKFNSLPEATKAKYAVVADEWKREGPPEPIKRRSVFHASYTNPPY